MGAPHFENDNLEDRIQMRCDLFALTANQLHRIGDAVHKLIKDEGSN